VKKGPRASKFDLLGGIILSASLERSESLCPIRALTGGKKRGGRI